MRHPWYTRFLETNIGLIMMVAFLVIGMFVGFAIGLSIYELMP